MPPHPGMRGELGVDASTLQQAQMTSLPPLPCWALLKEMSYCIRASAGLPMPLHGRGLRALAESPVLLENVTGRGICLQSKKIS